MYAYSTYVPGIFRIKWWNNTISLPSSEVSTALSGVKISSPCLTNKYASSLHDAERMKILYIILVY